MVKDTIKHAQKDCLNLKKVCFAKIKKIQKLY